MSQRATNLFANISTRTTEELASAVLHYLITTFPEARVSLLETLAGHLRRELLQDGFQAHLEFPTADRALEADPLLGRLDLVIETSDAVIGIENKIWAGFGYRQPE